jgi:hypothetical protein
VSRMRIFTAFAAMTACMCLGIGTAAAASITAGASGHSSSSVVSDRSSGDLGGTVHGNADAAQQTATGGGASNAGNTTGVTDNAGSVRSGQFNGDRLAAELYY